MLPAAGVNASISDMGKWLQALLLPVERLTVLLVFAAPIAELIQFVDVPLEVLMVDEICTLAQLIYDYVIGEP